MSFDFGGPLFGIDWILRRPDAAQESQGREWPLAV
jgi:hypothetical protein